MSFKTTDTDTHAAHSVLFISVFKASINREEEEETKRMKDWDSKVVSLGFIRAQQNEIACGDLIISAVVFKQERKQPVFLHIYCRNMTAVSIYRQLFSMVESNACFPTLCNQMLTLFPYMLYVINNLSDVWLMLVTNLPNLSTLLVFAMKNALIFQNDYLLPMAPVMLKLTFLMGTEN